MALRIDTRTSLELLIQFIYTRSATEPTVFVTNLDTAATRVLTGDDWALTTTEWEHADSVYITATTVQAPQDIRFTLDVGHSVHVLKATRMTCELAAPPHDTGMTFNITAAGGGRSHSVRVEMPAASTRARSSLTIGPRPGDPEWKIPIIIGPPTIPTGGGPKGWEEKLKALVPRGAEEGVLHLVETLRDERLLRALEHIDDAGTPLAARLALRHLRDLARQLLPSDDPSLASRDR